MTANAANCPELIARVQGLFHERGWLPLLPIKIDLLRKIDERGCRAVLERVAQCRDRVDAVSAILDEVKRHEQRTSPPPAPPGQLLSGGQ